ncbi:MAG: hypothetical protein M1820_009797 [Bogoriella megaspora]|nr:MAG: hypothetical protein M1820_009797 [Bogoriella megaspora]
MSHSGPPADDIRPNTAKELKRLGCLYSRFHLTRQKPIPRPPPRQPPGDIPGSRTWELAMSSSSQATKEITHTVKQKVVLEAGDVLMQFCAATSLVKPHTNRGLVSSSIQLSEGIMRIWRHWLSVRSKETSDSGRSETAQASPKDDERILWANDGQNDVGLKLRVRQQKNKGGRPVLFGSEDESSVSYSIEYEELLIRTSLLLLKSEQAREKRNLGTGKAVLFGSLRRAPTQTQDS